MFKPFIIDLFDGEDPADPGQSDPADPVADPVVPRSRTAVLSTKDPDTEIRLRELDLKLKTSNAEAAERRRENKALKDKLDNVEKVSDAIRTRTVRTEAKLALREAGILHDDMLDIFLKRAGDKIKVDDNFDVTGIEDFLNDFKESHKVFFKQPEKVETPEEKAAREEAEKPTKTANGASLAGSSGEKTSTLADPNDKRTASEMIKAELKKIGR